MSEEVKSIIEEPFYPEDCTDIRAQKNSKRIEKLEDRCTKIESDIHDLDVGFEERISALEEDVNTETTGLKDRVSAIETDLNTASTGLKARVSALEANSATTTYVDNAISAAVLGVINANY